LSNRIEGRHDRSAVEDYSIQVTTELAVDHLNQLTVPSVNSRLQEGASFKPRVSSYRDVQY
jgi:hypothetical protein